MGQVIVTISIALVFAALSTVGLVATVRGRRGVARVPAAPTAVTAPPVRVEVTYGPSSQVQPSVTISAPPSLWQSEKASAS